MIKPYVSIVIPVYNEQDNLEALYSRLIAVMDKIGKPFEILFTNDGSRDRSGAMLKEFHAPPSERGARHRLQRKLRPAHGHHGRLRAECAAMSS